MTATGVPGLQHRARFGENHSQHGALNVYPCLVSLVRPRHCPGSCHAAKAGKTMVRQVERHERAGDSCTWGTIGT